jgi:hypothetical protein
MRLRFLFRRRFPPRYCLRGLEEIRLLDCPARRAVCQSRRVRGRFPGPPRRLRAEQRPRNRSKVSSAHRRRVEATRLLLVIDARERLVAVVAQGGRLVARQGGRQRRGVRKCDSCIDLAWNIRIRIKTSFGLSCLEGVRPVALWSIAA